MSMPLFRATPILVLWAPKSMPTTLMAAVESGFVGWVGWDDDDDGNWIAPRVTEEVKDEV